MADIEFIEPATAESDEDQLIDLESAAPHGEPCDACGCPVEPLDKFCVACGNPNPAVQAGIPTVVQADIVEQAAPPVAPQQDEKHKYFRCKGCGSEVATDPDQRSYVCPFCDSTYVVEFSREHTGRQRPEFIIGFSVTPEQARGKFETWLGQNSWFRPGDLKTQSVAEKQRGVYLPFWSFSMLAQSSWSASIGEYWYRTETYTTTDSKGRMVTRTRQVRETEWWPLSGNHHRYYNAYMVSGSRGLSQTDADRIKPFQLPALRRYEPYYLAGWMSEEYSIDRDEALAISKQTFYERERQNISALLPGDTHRSLNLRTQFGEESSDLCLLPIYVLSYRYQDKLFRFLVNGQTGKVAGDKPWSQKRIAAFVIGIILLILLIVLGVLAVSGAMGAMQ